MATAGSRRCSSTELANWAACGVPVVHPDAAIRPAPVVGLTSWRVAQDLVGLGDLSKPHGCLGVFWMRVGMDAEGQASVRPDDLVVGGAPTHLEATIEGALIAGAMVWNRTHNLSHLLTDFLSGRYPNT